MTLTAHQSHSMTVSTRRRPTMMPSASSAQLPLPRTFSSPGLTCRTQPVFAQKTESYSVRVASVIGTPLRHGIERGEDHLVGEITGHAEQYQGVRPNCSAADTKHVRLFPSCCRHPSAALRPRWL